MGGKNTKLDSNNGGAKAPPSFLPHGGAHYFYFLQCSTKVGYDYLSGDGAGLIACQEQQDVSYIDGHAGLNLQVHVLVHLAHHVGIQGSRIGVHGHRSDDGAGIYRVASDAGVNVKSFVTSYNVLSVVATYPVTVCGCPSYTFVSLLPVIVTATSIGLITS